MPAQNRVKLKVIMELKAQMEQNLLGVIQISRKTTILDNFIHL